MKRRIDLAVGIALFAVWIVVAHGSLRAELGDGFTYALIAAFGIALGMGLLWPPASRAFAQALVRPPTWAFLLATSAIAAGVTFWFELSPMRGQTASLDGSTYTFQARALAHLSFGFPIPPPRLPFGLRFLFEGADGKMHGVFPIGYPLFLSPFLAIGAPLLAGATMAALLVLAQYAVTNAIAKTELTARLAVLLTLPSWGRVIETAEPVSHPLVAIMVAFAIVLALRLRTSPKPWRVALALGACAGWAFIARLLDGIVLGVVLGPVLLFWALRGRIAKSALPCIALGALPFVALLFAQQHAATGSYFRPNVSEYAVRSDWPPTCLRLGIGEDIGCMVEHPLERAAFGPDGYQLDDAFRLIRERAEVLGPDLVGSSLLLLLAFVPLLFWSRQDAKAPRSKEEGERASGILLAAGFLVAVTIAYGLYYYGNHPIWGARHLFSAAPLAWGLMAVAIERLPHREEGKRDAVIVQGSAAFALLLTASIAAYPVWKERMVRVHHDQANRIDVRALIADEKVERGIVTTLDLLSALVGWDAWADGDERFVVFDAPFGAHDLRALHPTLPVFETRPPGSIGPVEPPPPRGFWIELERAWPSFQRPHGLGAGAAYGEETLNHPALYVFDAKPGATLTLPIWIPKDGRYAVKLVSIKGPDHGDYKVTLDGQVLPLHRGYSPERKRVSSPASVPLQLSAGRHELVFECLGKQKESGGYQAIFDMLVGVDEE